LLGLAVVHVVGELHEVDRLGAHDALELVMPASVGSVTPM
jgi:hypothetical protein